MDGAESINSKHVWPLSLWLIGMCGMSIFRSQMSFKKTFESKSESKWLRGSKRAWECLQVHTSVWECLRLPTNAYDDAIPMAFEWLRTNSLTNFPFLLEIEKLDSNQFDQLESNFSNFSKHSEVSKNSPERLSDITHRVLSITSQ